MSSLFRGEAEQDPIRSLIQIYSIIIAHNLKFACAMMRRINPLKLQEIARGIPRLLESDAGGLHSIHTRANTRTARFTANALN